LVIESLAQITFDRRERCASLLERQFFYLRKRRCVLLVVHIHEYIAGSTSRP
jgi:hypothetical protein